jgi:hypothetical protein
MSIAELNKTEAMISPNINDFWHLIVVQYRNKQLLVQ